MAEIVKSYMQQLKTIVNELDNIRDRKKTLDTKKKELEEKITTYLKKYDQPAVKYDDIIVFANEKCSRVKLKKSEKKQSVHEALVNLGINDPDEVLKAIDDASKGDEIKKNSIQIKRMKK